MIDGKIRSFRDLIAWQEGHTLVVSVYKVTKGFPREEMYSLTDQMRRAAASITANIAEGFGRHTFKEKVQFYYMAQGSLLEVKNFIFIAKDVGYLDEEAAKMLHGQIDQAHRLLQGLIQKTKSFSISKSS